LKATATFEISLREKDGTDGSNRRLRDRLRRASLQNVHCTERVIGAHSHAQHFSIDVVSYSVANKTILEIVMKLRKLSCVQQVRRTGFTLM